MKNLTENKFFRIFGLFLLIAVIFGGGYFLFYINEYMCVNGQEIFYGYEPLWNNRGRYFSAFLTYFFVGKLPVLLNIHPFDIRPVWAVGFQSAIVCCIVFLITNGLFLFSKEKCKFLNPFFSIFYVIVFFEMVNPITGFFCFYDLNEFFEYIMQVIPAIGFLSFLVYFFTKDSLPRKKMYLPCLILTFFTAYSVETINIPFFALLTLLVLYQAARYKFYNGKCNFEHLKLLSKLKKWLNLYKFYMFFCLFYFIRSTDHQTIFDINIFKDNFIYYYQTFYTNFINNLQVFYYIFIILLFSLFVFKKKNLSSNVRISFLLVSNLLIHLFYLSVCCFIIACLLSKDMFYQCFLWERTLILFRGMLIFSNLILVSYLIDLNEQKVRKFSIFIKILLIVIFVIINKNVQNIKNCFAEANILRNQIYAKRVFWYEIQKRIIEQKDKDVITLPYNDDWSYPYKKNSPIVKERYVKLILLNLYNEEDFRNRKQKTCIIIDEAMPVEKLNIKESSDLNFTKQMNKKIIRIPDSWNLIKIKNKSSKEKTP